MDTVRLPLPLTSMSIQYYASRKTASTPFRTLLGQSGSGWAKIAPAFFVGAAIYRGLEDSWPGGFWAMFGAIYLTCLFHGLVFWYLGRRADPARVPGWLAFIRRTGVYFVATLVLEAGVLLVTIPALLLGLVAASILGLIGLPGPVALVAALGITLVPALIVSIGGVLFGCVAILGGSSPWQAIVTSFRLARLDWKLTGALVTVPYTLLFLVDWIPWTLGMYQAVRSQWRRIPAFSPRGLSVGIMNRWMAHWSQWFDRVSRLGRLPPWYRFGLGPALEGLAVLYALTTLWVLYAYFTGTSMPDAPAPVVARPLSG